ncbi:MULTISPECIES: Cof-type HAD-IIB family hydrolase [Aerococcus]|uniref:Cof-type HAD-IIB family hydrolase n=1 Tax=Aerococcus TaxID=1375 RepID=UPI0018A6E1CF|nr:MULTISPECIES: Cof-type HAD-IIB family hydrolase [Aerococcus]MCY3035256.1 Cof-type HAD-IIB family hydrolase [Aerococcus sp. Group 2]MCY3038679.1 Cof-type HAD-IIB family hydrolase [Aerococcus sp. Group 2]MCY3040834.1 Cof-type HAD-IIB family hydrolase [Aerococcus sp. Group 2]MCY3042071.1 Cof-type HAD-IIB family hydrolase [Aerococcus sp. Group 2]MDK6521067.1 Cof-type HAD-IIB family hydrolase [Aerococcus urinae]
MIKLIAIDLDGTLLRDDKTISEANASTIRRAVEAGIEVVICTGRPIEGIQFALDRFNMNTAKHFSITYNGGLVLHNDSREIISETIMTTADVLRIYDMMYGLDLPIDAVDIDTVHRLKYPKDWPGHYDQQMPFLPFVHFDLDALGMDHHFYKTVTNTPKEHIEDQLSKLPDWLYQDYSVMRSHGHQLEVMPKGVDKGQGLAALANYLKIDVSEVMAIGDEENDKAMLQWAGTAVVMANGNETIKKYADYITKSNMDDGVAHAIEELVLKS